MTEPPDPQPAAGDPQAAPAAFAALGLPAATVATLGTLGYEEPTPIQREAIPPLLAGRDVLGQAATGTGKTAAFALPLLVRVAAAGTAPPGRPHALVLVPTRELAMQVAQAIHRYAKGSDTRVLPIYGGQPFGQQLRGLQRGVEVVVATPGRALDHLERETLSLEGTSTVVLDEADEMLDMGFADDLEAILGRLPAGHQTALFSATLPARILAIARKHLQDPVRVAIAHETTPAGELPRVRQVAYVVPRAHKLAALGRVLDLEAPTSAIVFCRTRLEVDELTEAMNARGFTAQALHGGFAQEQRDRVMKRFRANQVDLLIATDVAARGLDVEHVSHVVNYDVPTEPDAYVHRIGRTGRAGREGVAITLLTPREHRLLKNIQHATRQTIAIATIPTVAELHQRRLERTRATLRATVAAGELDEYRRVVGELAEELDLLDVAAAALKLAHGTAPAPAEEASGEALDRSQLPGEHVRAARYRRDEAEAAVGDDTGARVRVPRGRPGRHRPDGVVRLFVGAGRQDGLRPGDLVGAIANETGLPGSAIGAIEITERFALVDVPAAEADRVVRALRATNLRGRRVVVRRDRSV